jgi:uncharacterized Zn-finger protein
MFACLEVECARRFTRKYTLEERMKSHTGGKPHICPVKTCAKNFSTSGNLLRHSVFTATLSHCVAPLVHVPQQQET